MDSKCLRLGGCNGGFFLNGGGGYFFMKGGCNSPLILEGIILNMKDTYEKQMIWGRHNIFHSVCGQNVKFLCENK